MEPYFKPITVDMIYVSPLKAKLVEKDGWEKVLPVDKTVPPTGSIIMDAVADILKHTTISSVKGLAAQLKVKPKELSGAIHILTHNLKELGILRQHRNRNIVPDAVVLAHAVQRLQVAAQHRIVERDRHVGPLHLGDCHIDVHLASADAGLHQLLEALLQKAVGAGSAAGKIKIAMVDRLDLHRDITPVIQPLMSAVAGHAVCHLSQPQSEDKINACKRLSILLL